jgi:hypothetical protein
MYAWVNAIAANNIEKKTAQKVPKIHEKNVPERTGEKISHI